MEYQNYGKVQIRLYFVAWCMLLISLKVVISVSLVVAVISVCLVAVL